MIPSSLAIGVIALGYVVVYLGVNGHLPWGDRREWPGIALRKVERD